MLGLETYTFEVILRKCEDEVGRLEQLLHSLAGATLFRILGFAIYTLELHGVTYLTFVC